MNPIDIRVRPALPSDCPAMAKIHVETWRSDYRGFAPDDYLASLSVDEEGRAYRATIKGVRSAAFLAEDGADRAIGLVTCGAYRDEGYRLSGSFQGEIYNLYVVPGHRKAGAGRALLSGAARWLQTREMGSMMLWTLEGYTSKAFYARLGGRVVGRRRAMIGTNEVVDLAFGWEDVGLLIAD